MQKSILVCGISAAEATRMDDVAILCVPTSRVLLAAQVSSGPNSFEPCLRYAVRSEESYYVFDRSSSNSVGLPLVGEMLLIPVSANDDGRWSMVDVISR